MDRLYNWLGSADYHHTTNKLFIEAAMTTPEPEEILDELLDNVWRSNGGNPDPVLKAKIVAALAAHTKAAVIEELEEISNGGADGTWDGYGKAVQKHVDGRIAELEQQLKGGTEVAGQDAADKLQGDGL